MHGCGRAMHAPRPAASLPHGSSALRAACVAVGLQESYCTAGVILYALLASALPFDAGDVHALVRLIQLGKPTSPVPPERGADAEQLVHAMLSVDAKARPTASAVLEARWAMGTAAQIKASATQLTLPATAAGSGRRRGASETTQFFKQMRGQVEEEDSDPLRRNAAAGRAKGERLTRDELQKIKRSSEEERPQQPAQPAAPAPLSSVSATDAQPAGRRKGGAALTKEEREEIKRERAAAAALKTGPAS